MDPFDKTRCSLQVPTFRTTREEREWMWSLTPEQRFELLRLAQIYRYGEEALRQPMDRTAIRKMTIEEFNEVKTKEDAADKYWYAEQKFPETPNRLEKRRTNAKTRRRKEKSH